MKQEMFPGVVRSTECPDRVDLRPKNSGQPLEIRAKLGPQDDSAE